MRISFDLDDTLICYKPGVPAERPLPWLLRAFSTKEPLRLGAYELMTTLAQNGHELWIYTTSYRAPHLVKRWLRFYGIRVAGVINQVVHETRLREWSLSQCPSKYPSAFGIHLHIDDSIGVKIEGDRLGFHVVVVDPTDVNWTDHVLKVVEGFNPRPHGMRP